MNTLPSHMFCSKHSDCEAPISVITEILSENDPIKFENISNQFKTLGFTTVKDLAQTTFGKASSIKLSGDSLRLLYKALEMYDERLDDLQKSAKLEMENRNFIRTQQICEELLQQKPNDINILILMAESFYKCGDHEQSISFLKRAYNLNHSYKMLMNIAFNYWKLSNYDSAKYYFVESIKKSPRYNNCWMYYAEMLLKTNDIRNAEYIYVNLLKAYPDSNTIRNKYGQFLLSQNKLNNAQQQFQIALKSDPQCPDTISNLGDLYSLANQSENAILYYCKALEINANLKITWFNLGKVYAKESNYPKAVEAFEKAIDLDSENVSALRYLAVTYCIQKKMLMSVETFKKCLKLLPDDLEINLELAMINYHYFNNYIEAENYFKKCIELQPQRDDILKYLYAVYLRLKKHKDASDACISLGHLYLDKSDLENAKNAFISALYITPDNADGHWKLGLTFHKLGQYDSALIRYRKAIELKPNFAHPYCDSAVIYEKQNMYEKALEYYKMTLQLQPDHLNALINMSLLKQKIGQFDDIVDIFNRILQIDESDAFDIHMNLANILHKEIGNLNDALCHYEKALTYDNTSVEIHVRMGKICIELNMSKKALNYFHMAIQLDAQCLEAFINIGAIQKDSDNFIDAIHAYEATLKLKPDFPEVYCNLVICLLKVCDWSEYDSHMMKLKEILNKQLDGGQVLSLLPHDTLLLPLSFEVQKVVAEKYAQHCIEKLKKSIEESQQFVYSTSLVSSNGNLRIGFVLTNFSEHPKTAILESLSSLKDYQIDVICYSLTRLNLFSDFKKHKDLSHLKVIDAAKLINNDGIHILVDMCGYTKDSQTELFALRPAPIQVSWLGYRNTSGAPFMDYLITDKVCSPPEFKNLYTEKLAFMNQTVFVGDHKQKFPNLHQLSAVDNTNNISYQSLNGNNSNEIKLAETIYIDDESVLSYSRSQYNLPENAVVFCNFSKLYNIDRFTFNLWLTILIKVPNSVLWLLHLNDDVENNLIKYADNFNNGCFDSSRIIFADFIPKCEHLKRIQLADIYLDTCLYNGHTASLDALWAEVPVVTLPGETYASRITASQLTTSGVTDTIAKNDKQYIDIVIKLCLNRQFLEHVKKCILKLKTNSDLFDINSYAIKMISILKSMWNNYPSIHELDMSK